MNVGVLPNLDKRGASEIVERLAVVLKKLGFKAYIPDNICAANYIPLPVDKLIEISDIIITVGGDGTIIRYAKLSAKLDKPILGINAGRLGFLANIEQNELNLLTKLKNNNYTVEERMLLKIDVSDGKNLLSSSLALNDAVITSGFISRIIDIKAYFGDDCISYRADGLIISTPTGSTAYSLSAGGPIIDPLSENICITPICSHSLSAKPILLNKNSVIKFKAYSLKKSDIYLSIDGRKSAVIKPSTEITVSKSDYSVKLIRLNNRSFYKTISEKFKEK